jgi:predicted Zn-dependent peptidase
MKYTQKKLPNGIRVILHPMQNTETVTVMTLVETGSKYETKKQNGLSHFLEHMCFKGTTRRPNSFLISKELDEIGAQYNAFTSHEYTGYYAKSADNHFERIFDVVSDIYLNPLFPEKEIEKEKGVIIEEINMYQDDPKRHIFEVFMHALYGDQPAGWSITGSKENVKSMKRTDFVNYHDTHYIPEKTLIVISGKFNTQHADALIKKTFSKITNKKGLLKKKTKDTQSRPMIVIEKKKTDQVHFVLGFRSVTIYDKDSHIFDVLNAILSGGFSSRLLMKLREELGAAYYVTSFSDPFTDHGFFGIRAGITKTKTALVLSEIISILKDLCTNEVSHIELKKAKEYCIGGMKLDLETSDSFANFLGGQAIVRKPIENLTDIEKKINSVTSKDIQRICKKTFNLKKITIALIGENIKENDIAKSLV